MNDKEIENLEEISIKIKNDTIEDSFGNSWSKICPEGSKLTRVVIRPGKVQCENCG
jgi:hypothetical protein